METVRVHREYGGEYNINLTIKDAKQLAEVEAALSPWYTFRSPQR